MVLAEEAAKEILNLFCDPENFAIFLKCYFSKTIPDKLIEIIESYLTKATTEKLDHLYSIMSESQGVAGWHKNGDIALWDEFPILTEGM